MVEAFPAVADLRGVGGGAPEGGLLPEGGHLLAHPVVGRRVGEGAGGAGAVEAEALGEGGEGGEEHLAEHLPPLLAGHKVTVEWRPGGGGGDPLWCQLCPVKDEAPVLPIAVF